MGQILKEMEARLIKAGSRDGFAKLQGSLSSRPYAPDRLLLGFFRGSQT